MPLFLVEGKVRIRQYMADEHEIVDKNMLVEADDAASAEEMYERYWSAHTSLYSVYYYGYVNSVTPVLTKQMVIDKVANQKPLDNLP